MNAPQTEAAPEWIGKGSALAEIKASLVEGTPESRPTAARCAVAGGSLSGYFVKIKKHRGADVPSYYVVCFDGHGDVVGVLACPGDGWWTKTEAKAAGARWLSERAEPTENVRDDLRGASPR